MFITKYGHSCLLVEDNNTRLLIDPGQWSSGFEDLQKIDVLLITHTHVDHYDVEAIQKLLGTNADMLIISNEEVCRELNLSGIACTSVSDGEVVNVKGVSIGVYGHDHAVIYGSVPCRNIGFLINNRLYHPGDSFFAPPIVTDMLALPVCGPWLKTSEAVDFAKELKPRLCFPIHDAMLKHAEPFYDIAREPIEEAGIQFTILEDGVRYEFPAGSFHDQSKHLVEGGAGQDEQS